FDLCSVGPRKRSAAGHAFNRNLKACSMSRLFLRIKPKFLQAQQANVLVMRLTERSGCPFHPLIEKSNRCQFDYVSCQ
ncbi:hypothetical protein, partial [Klebsiella variicola]